MNEQIINYVSAPKNDDNESVNGFRLSRVSLVCNTVRNRSEMPRIMEVLEAGKLYYSLECPLLLVK